MKKIVFLLLFSTVTFSSFSQTGNSPTTLTKQDYLQKSKKQKTAAWILLGGGAAVGVIGLTQINVAGSDYGDPKNGAGTVLFFTGAAATLSSIHFFSVSSKNKRKAMSVSFKNNPSQQIQRGSFVNRSLPSLTFKIHL